MKLLAHLSLAVAAFIYLIPLQVVLAQPFHTGNRGLATAIALLLFTVLFWICLLVSWCSLLAQGGFSWIAVGRPVQFIVMLAGWLALTAVTTLSIGLRGDSQLPMALRPWMPWAIYVIPAIMVGATAVLLVPGWGAVPQVLSVARNGLGLFSVVAFVSAIGIAAEFTVLRSRDREQAFRRAPAAREANIRRLVHEVEALDPQNDLARLLLYTGRDRFDEPRNLAVGKIQSHPRLSEALATLLVSDRSHLALGYLENNAPPDMELLTEPVRQAILNLAPWIRREITNRSSLNYSSFFREIDMALQVANQFVAMPETGHLAAVRELRAAFDSPKAKNANVDAIRLLDDWLRQQSALHTAKPSLTHHRSH